jgi:prepilin-type processing-associated H-X9-DG protein
MTKLDSFANANLDRFSGFADLYDAHRPSPPVALGPLLARYCLANQSANQPAVVDIGSGTGLSSRWAATWASSVIGVEPNLSMRTHALAGRPSNVTYVDGHSTATGLVQSSADVVIVVQAMHWMEPIATLAEVDRILRPGGVFATVDADWPPVTGVVTAEAAWATLHKRMRVFEARIADGQSGEQLRRPLEFDDPALLDESLSDTHRNRKLPGGVKSWSKDQHLGNITSSGLFVFTRELLFDQVTQASAEKFIALIRSQGSYQDLRKRGLTDYEIGMGEFELAVTSCWVESQQPTEMSFSWRVRLGCKPR